MSRRVRGAPPNPYGGTSATVYFAFGPSTSRPGALHKLVDVVCDECGTQAITFSKDGPEGWTQRYRPLGTRDLCPACSAKHEDREPTGVWS